jgi:hypothetical protein
MNKPHMKLSIVCDGRSNADILIRQNRFTGSVQRHDGKFVSLVIIGILDLIHRPYSKNKKEYNVSETGSVSILR